MSDIKDWSPLAAQNNDAPPDGWPEGMAPSDVNNAARENMAAIRRQHEDSGWVDLGDVPTYVSATSFTIPGDHTGIYQVGRRLRATEIVTVNVYGTIETSVYANPNTTVTLTIDSGVLTGSLSAVAVSVVDANGADTSAGIPIGGIIMYDGLLADIPFNYALCDGTNGTPDLTDQFIMGTNTELEIGDTGGSADAVVVLHQHGSAGVHDHNARRKGNSGSTVDANDSATGDSYSNLRTSEAGNHQHPAEGEDGTGKNIPPYVKLAYIKRIS